ncbi:hypothetical protein Avbf_12184 [Armadillidium vulgare]|nr:hypothetical protein Avbf_12184 [Armadillidium vulgare]
MSAIKEVDVYAFIKTIGYVFYV